MSHELKVVGNCPKCGGPIYSTGQFHGNTPPSNTYSCECRNQQKTTSAETKPLIKHGARIKAFVG